jgi:hypothetical protein
MSSNNSPAPFVASGNGLAFGPTYDYFQAFDRADTYWIGPSGVNALLQLDMGASNAPRVTRYTIKAATDPANTPTAFTIQGSNNGTDWTTVDTRSGLAWAGTETKSFDVASPGAYRYYRLNTSALQGGGGSTNAALWELAYYANASSYPTTDYWWVATTDLSQFTWTNVSWLNSVTVAGTQPANTNRKWLVSFDGRVTWMKWDGAAWQTHVGGLGDIANGNTTAEMETGLTNIDPLSAPGSVGLDFAVALQTTDAAVTPTVDGLTINYDEPARYDPATVGAYGAATEFGVQRIDATTTKVKNQTVTTQKVFIQMTQPAAP